MAPPALRLWLPTWCLYSPCFSSWSSLTSFLTAVLNADAWGCSFVFYSEVCANDCSCVIGVCCDVFNPAYEGLYWALCGLYILLVNELVTFAILLVSNF